MFSCLGVEAGKPADISAVRPSPEPPLDVNLGCLTLVTLVFKETGLWTQRTVCGMVVGGRDRLSIFINIVNLTEMGSMVIKHYC